MKRRILLTTSTFPQRLGDGLPRFVYDLAHALTRQYQVVVLAPHAGGLALEEAMGQVEVRRFPYFWPRHVQQLAYGSGMRGNMKASLLARIQPPFYVSALTRAVRHLLRSEDFALVNSHWLVPNALATARAGLGRHGVPHVTTVHGGDMALVRKLPGGEWAARYVAARSQAMLVSGSHIAGQLQEIIPEPPPIRVQPMGTHADHFAPVPDEAPPLQPFAGGYLLFVGRLIPIKGADVLLYALPAIREQAPDVGLLLAGYGPMEARLKRIAAELGLEDRVRFLGRQPHENIARYLRHARVAVVPSTVHEGESEGMPTVVSEALAASTPLVATASGGIPDVIRHGENGYLCEAGDPASLAERVSHVLDLPPEELARLRRNARETGQRMNWEAVASRYAAVFDALIDGRPVP